jgi:hypothetical protein
MVTFLTPYYQTYTDKALAKRAPYIDINNNYARLQENRRALQSTRYIAFIQKTTGADR